MKTKEENGKIINFILWTTRSYQHGKILQCVKVENLNVEKYK